MDKNIFIKGVNEKYPKELLDGRITTEGNVVACIWKDPLLLDEIKLSKDDFITRDGRFLFSLAKSLRNKHLNVLDEVSVLSNSKEEVIEKLNSIGGYTVIENMVDIINLNNWDVYSDELYRENVLIKLYNDGFNLFKEVQYKDKKIIPIKLFRKMTAEQVLDYYETQLSCYEIGQSSSVIEESEIYFDEDWLEELEDELDLGIPFDIAGEDINGDLMNCFPFLSRQTLGLFRKTLMMVAGFSSTGKSTYMVTIIMALLYQGEKVVIISNEETIKKFKIKFMMWILAKYNRYYSLTKSKLTAGNLSEEDKKQIRIAMKYFNENYKGCLRFVGLTQVDISIVKKKIRESALKYGCSAFLLDTFKLAEGDMSNARQDLSLVRDSRELHKLAMKYEMIGMATIQLAEYLKGTLSLTASALSNAKQVKEILESLFLIRACYDEELDPKSKYYCHPFRLKKTESGIWVEEPYEPDRMASYRILSVEKNRNGEDTGGNGVSYLLKFDGSHSVFREVAQCRTKHGTIQ